MWRIEIPGVPVAQPRAGHHHLRRRDGSLLTRPDGDPIIKTYQPTPIAEWKARAAWAMRQGRGAEPPLVGPVSLIVRAVFPCPPSQHRERVPRPARWHTHRPDLDNIVKAVKDAAKGVLWLDDSQVCVLGPPS
jgi:Holliday junction resolvase RusA-like endonuclease